MSSPIVERLVAEQLEALRAELELRQRAELAELAAELREEIDRVARRLDNVHREALKAVTRLLEVRQ